MMTAITIPLHSSLCRLILACITCHFQLAASHGRMVTPKPRQPEPLYWYQVGCMIGCNCSGGGKENYPSLASVACDSPAQPTNTKAEHLTWNIDSESPQGAWNAYMPWRAPGTSKPLDPCGIAGGFLPSAKVQYPHKFAHSSIFQAMKGTDLPKGSVTVWTSGETVEASFTLVVNHGGGYQYRVCPTNKGTVDEACFEANPLKFADAMHRVRYLSSSGAMVGNEISLNATDVIEGVMPAGAAWRRLPMPSCNCDLGEGCSAHSKGDFTKSYRESESISFCTTGVQFDAPHLKDGTWPEGLGYYLEGITPGYRKATKTMTRDTENKGPNDHDKGPKAHDKGPKDHGKGHKDHDTLYKDHDKGHKSMTMDRDGKHMLDWTAGFRDSAARETNAESGSTLVFEWKGSHDVYKMANEEALLNCNFTDAVQQGAGSPVMVKIPENATKGSQLFFACSVGTHCQMGQHITVNITDKVMTSADEKIGDGQEAKDTNATTNGTDATSLACNGCLLQSTCYDPAKYGWTKGTCELKGGNWNYMDDTEEASDYSPRVEAGRESCTSFKNKAACQVESGCTWYSGKGGVCYEPAGYSKGKDDKTDFGGSDYGNDEDSSGDKAPGWVVVDKLIAPSETGHYILQWRWDNEQTPQIWTTCADIEVVAAPRVGAATDSAPSFSMACGLFSLMILIVART